MGRLCIGHLGHLHHLLTADDLAVLGQLNPRIILPMHYWSQEVLGRFLARMRDKAEIRLAETDSFTASRVTLPVAPQVLVLPTPYF